MPTGSAHPPHMDVLPQDYAARLLEDRGPSTFRRVFGDQISRSSVAETAILRIRLGGVDLSHTEVANLTNLRVLVAEVNARTVEEEAYAMVVDPLKRENLERVLVLLQKGVLEIRSAPLGDWSPDFTVFSRAGQPWRLLLGLHVFYQPPPHRGPAWGVLLGPREANRARQRFRELWCQAHDIGDTIRQLMEFPAARGPTQSR